MYGNMHAQNQWHEINVTVLQPHCLRTSMRIKEKENLKIFVNLCYGKKFHSLMGPVVIEKMFQIN